MKKRLLTLACMITCLLGLTACGGEEALTSYEQQKVTAAEQMASQIVTIFADYLCDDEIVANVFNGSQISEFTAEEISYVCEQTFGLQADGNTLISAIDSFRSGLDTIGGITLISSAEAKISDKQIIVNVDITGQKKNAEAEIIFSNDLFLVLESASLSPTASMGELMGKAALNTLVGMGTVFAVLILISLIISCFAFIPKIQKALSDKKSGKTAETEQGAVSQSVEPVEETAVDESDDLELVAVIAAAIAASEGAASADGFVVRSIRRRAQA
ncbi:MAG: OadG family protein [Roseburia sp.]|nr:OadG family protein [Roseburia sp.]MCM1097311.1 OadG family protein [Ruminococcus flavefaciens]